MLGVFQLLFRAFVAGFTVLFYEFVYVLRRAVLLARVISQRGARK